MWKSLLSIFKWQKSPEKEPEHSKTDKIRINTVKDLKTWVETELPPLAWSRISLKVLKYSLDKHNLILIKTPEDTVLPEDLLIEINNKIKETYNKELTY